MDDETLHVALRISTERKSGLYFILRTGKRNGVTLNIFDRFHLSTGRYLIKVLLVINAN